MTDKIKLSTVPSGRIKNWRIGLKLTIGFGTLLLLTFLVIANSLLAGSEATTIINRTDQSRFPQALTSSEAEANLLRMQASVRGYLALGDPQYRGDYEGARLAFEANLRHLNVLAPGMEPLNQSRLVELEQTFEEWVDLPDQLFTLRDDQLAREPAYKILATDGVLFGGNVLINIRLLIDAQALRSPSADNIALVKDMANFQGSFAAMLSGLRNYTTTQNRIFRQEYEANLVLNDIAWEQLLDKQSRNLLTEEQKEILETIRQNRDAFLALPEEKIFPILESDRYRADLYLFTTEAVPRANLMLDLLHDMRVDQQSFARMDLSSGRNELIRSRIAIVGGGLVAVVAGVALSSVLRANIVGPVERLTGVASKIQEGDLEVLARVESKDEIGTLAATFNNMTGRLRQSLIQVSSEKKRADDLLHVVIPIGVALSLEKDFNRLLETMLVEAMQFCRAQAGTVYLRTDDEQLQFVIMRDNEAGLVFGGTSGPVPHPPVPLYTAGQPNLAYYATRAVHSQQTINSFNDDNSDQDAFWLTQSNRQINSYLTIPLKNSLGQIVGVLQLLDASEAGSGRVIPFDPNLQQMMESYSSLAVAALEAYIREQALRQEIRQLRIEIDEAKQRKQVDEIISSDFFSELQAKAQEIRQRTKPR